MTQLKTTLVDKLKIYVSIRTSLYGTFIVIVANLMLHILLLSFNYKFISICELLPKFACTPQGNMPIKFLVTVASTHSAATATSVSEKDQKFSLMHAAQLAKLQQKKLIVSSKHFLKWNAEILPQTCMTVIQFSLWTMNPFSPVRESKFSLVRIFNF